LTTELRWGGGVFNVPHPGTTSADKLMPNTKSAKKRLRQSLERRSRNRAVKSSLKTQIKKVHAAVEDGDGAAGIDEFRLAAKKLDQAAAKGVIHRNKAARLKSRLTKRLKAKPA
jgi:small subunit ribosomal protein S20